MPGEPTFAPAATETILVVDDEEPVRRTFCEWLMRDQPSAKILSAGDAARALELANQHVIDLAILDWNLGAGDNGLDLLTDLYTFNPDVVAIMITAYANLATPLDAMRRGVRDYLDKNQELNREVFLRAVRKQLEIIRPAKQMRRLHQSLVAFREAVEKILPLVQATAALHDPVTLPGAIRGLFQFLLTTTRAHSGVLLVRALDSSSGKESCRVYDAAGTALNTPLVPFPRSIAASALSLGEPCRMVNLAQAAGSHVELQPFEKDHFSLLATPLALTSDVHVVLELFDKRTAEDQLDRGGFSSDDARLVRDASEFGADLLRQALVQRQTHQVLLDAVAAALQASERVTEGISPAASPEQRLQEPPPPDVLDRLRQSFSATGDGGFDASSSLQLAEAIRVLALRHGPPAIQHCIELVESLKRMLDRMIGG